MGDELAVDDGTQRLSFRDLADEMTRVAASLIVRGIKPGDRVGVWGPNSARWITAALGVHAAGAVLVPLNTRFKGSEAAFVLRHSGCRAILVSQFFLGNDYLGLLHAADPGLHDSLLKVSMTPQGAAGDCVDWDTFLLDDSSVDGSTVAMRIAGVATTDPSDIIFTSGTTGTPKGVVLSHGQSLRAYEALNAGFGLRSGDRYLITNPFFHCFGYKAGWLLCLLVGATALPHQVFDAREVLDRIEGDRVSVVAGPPTMFLSLLDFADRHQDLSSLRYTFTAAASIPITLVRRMQTELSVDVGTGYGLTESTAVATVTRPTDDAVTVATTVGVAVEGVEISIVDADHSAVPTGVQGEVAIRGFNIMSGYWNDPSGTSAVIDADGWLYSGDVGVLDEGGYLRITDRLKDLVIVGGFNVSPVEVENALLEDDRLAQVAVVGIPDSRLGEVVAAFVVARPGAEVTAKDVVDHARLNIANYKVPRLVQVLEALPVNASGKVVKSELRVLATRGGYRSPE